MEIIERKHQALRIANLYQANGYHQYYSRIQQCMTFAEFIQKEVFTPEYYHGEIIDVDIHYEFRLNRANFCRVRHCPICQWRKAKRWQALALKDFPLIHKDYPNCRWLFLTLTVKNCRLKILRRTIKKLNLSFAKWVKWKSFPAIGWLKSLEVSLSDGMAHPHFHILLLVNNNYFQKDNYLSQRDWQSSWKKAAKLTYNPIIDIRAVPPKKETKVVPELLKYSIKPKDLAEISCDDLFILTNQVHNLRVINKGGVLRKYFKNLGDDNIDLIGVKGDNSRPTGVIRTLFFQHDDGSYIYQQNDDEKPIKISLINNEVDYSYYE